ncbi:hypothetical protein BRD18_00785 [Halobacteriales archaeon SW_7_71_33]|nr:MAG: hypothetical protein BRD18_00785 [Halobacteriales archaeon SW_7_71_33]
MSYLRYVAERLVFAVVSVYAVVTVMFLAVTATAWFRVEERLARAEFGGATEAELDRLRSRLAAERGLDRPPHERYLDWVVDVATLEWGDSLAYGEPVIAVLDGRVQTTLGYVLPGVGLATVLGVGLGVFVALDRDGLVDWGTRLGSYTLLAVPAFMFVLYAAEFSPLRLRPGVESWLVGTGAVATAVLAGQLRFARTAALEQTGRAFVKALRAKGTDRLRLGRHVLRNASLQVLSLSISELLSVMVLTVYVVEEVLPIDGLATASLRAVRESDIALVVWTTLVVVFVGIGANLLKDLLYGYLDPRVRAD